MAIISLVIFVGIAFGIYVWNNVSYANRDAKKVKNAGFNTRYFVLSSGIKLAYVEGPNTGPPLLLLHAQAASKRSYNPVLPELSTFFHVFAIDIVGHGKSDRSVDYTLASIADGIGEFITERINSPTYLSGHSSGGLLAAWLAANKPALVKATLYEDPPFFSTSRDRIHKQFNFVDLASPAHHFLQQSDETDFATYYVKHNAWIGYFGGAAPKIAKQAQSYRQKHPKKSINIWYLPPSVNESYADMHQFDPHFADAFYTYTWFEDLDQKDLLMRISQPSTLIHANWRITKEDILEGAMTDDDAQLACSLMRQCCMERVSTGHGFHVENPKRFIELARELLATEALSSNLND